MIGCSCSVSEYELDVHADEDAVTTNTANNGMRMDNLLRALAQDRRQS
jgi:hypothetical protein